MAATAMDSIWEILGSVFALNGENLQQAATFPDSLLLAIGVVLLAGLSLAIGQAIILFINQVKPIRFVFSLLVSAVLYLFEFLFLVLSTWIICLLPNSVHVSLSKLVIVLGLSYAPLLFSFLGALPYFGFPLLRLLSIWHLLAMVVGFGAIANLGAGFAFGYVAVGWFVKELLENTIGQPIAQFGKTIADWVAGVNLAKNREALAERVHSRFGAASPLLNIAPDANASSQPWLQASSPSSNEITERDRSGAPVTVPRSLSAATMVNSSPVEYRFFRLSDVSARIPQPIKLLLGLLGLVMLFAIVAILLRPIRAGIFGWYETLPRVPRLIFDLSWIGVVGLIFSGLLAPLETLGWWAGWFGDAVDTSQEEAPTPAPTRDRPNPPSRYVIYLDGVGQSGKAYTPDVETFLAALQPALPSNIQLVRGLMMYSVLNQPLNQDRPLAFLWKLADKLRWQNPAALLGYLVNVRNALIVMVSADQRYGPIYNRGIAQVLYNGLLQQGYQPGSAIPITLIGYSGGAQMSAASAPYLKQALGAPIDVISLGGVMSANNNYLKLEQLYHLIGDQDVVQRLGPLLFLGRRRILPLSYWNRALRKGKISVLSAGAIGHQVPGGYMDPDAFLADGRSHLQATIETILQILTGNLLEAESPLPTKLSNYTLYQQATFNQPDYYPLHQTVDLEWYQPIAPWMGRLILPERDDRSTVRGVLLEVHHAPPDYKHLVGQIVMLRWADTPFVRNLLQAAKRDVHFSVETEYSSRYGGRVHPDRLNHWQQVDPLESLAGSHEQDDVVVMLDSVQVEEGKSGRVDESLSTYRPIHPSTLYIHTQPVQITGRFVALVQFIQPIAGTDQFEVVHFNRATQQFDGWREGVRLPEVVRSEAEGGSPPSTTRGLEQSPLNETGWYIYGAKDRDGIFVVQALAPRALFRLQPDEVVFGQKASYRYIRQRSWADIQAQKGKIASVLCVGQSQKSSSIQAAIDEWQEGDRALLLHVYGGIGGDHAEPAAATPIFFGHFAFGMAQVVRDPWSKDLKFDIRYHQVYTHNTDGLVAGTLHWSRYMGDRQFGWLGNRPVCDILIKHPAFTGSYDFGTIQRSPLDYILEQLEVMTARYRIGDGTGGTYVGAANNCAQDSNQAVFAGLRQMEDQIRSNAAALQQWKTSNPEQAARFAAFVTLNDRLRRKLQPLGGPKSVWERNEYNLGTTLEDEPLRNLITGLGSWRTMLPRLASDTVVKIFLDQGARVWVLRTNQIGGYDPHIEPIAPMTL
ncbi:MAG: CAAX protease [Leptolyngbyaceae cyanobacterium bins.302]|nr:CAAX protease [Leptolyngbyaceae cyanobacterium bins.302]